MRGPAQMQAAADRWRRRGLTIGVVPTMGALHAGHESLVRRSLAENDVTVVSIFVNPLQFGPAEDYSSYPRTFERDSQRLGSLGVDAIYAPSVEAMYRPGATTRVRVAGLDQPLEGTHRPGHFEGVATVVAKLFNATRPHRAYFGQKDAQQLAVVTRMTHDLDFGIEIVACPTVREPDGLALSSRNVYLDPRERVAARVLSRSLMIANEAFAAGVTDPQRLRELIHAELATEPLAVVDYAEVVDPLTFDEPGDLAVVAVRIGGTRLIDNHRLGTPLGIG